MIASRNGHLGLKQSEETKNKRGISLREYWSNVDDFTKKNRNEKIKKTRLENGGYIVTDEMKNKISETLKSKKLTSAVSIKIKKYNLDGDLIETYISMLKAEESNGFGRGTLYYNIIKKGKEIYKGFKWIINNKN